MDPIILYQGQILDGRNRYKACQLAGLRPWVEEFSALKTKRNLEEFVLSRNLRRRHLTVGQKAAIALEWADQIALRPNSDKSKSTGRPRGAVLEAAKHIGIDRQRVFEARVIRSSNQSLYQQLKAGSCSIHSALAEVRGTPENPLDVSGSGRATALSGGLDEGDGTLGQVRRTGAKIVPSPQKPSPNGSSAFVNPTTLPPPTPATLDKALARIKAKLGNSFQAEVKASLTSAFSKLDADFMRVRGRV